MARFESWHMGCLVIVALIQIHLYVSPFTKVEESFNIQAIHDILKYGVPTQNVYLKLKAQYDHMTFSGAVPRTFVGPLILAAVAKPFILYGQLNGQQQQMLGITMTPNNLVPSMLTKAVSTSNSRPLQWCIAHQLRVSSEASIWLIC